MRARASVLIASALCMLCMALGCNKQGSSDADTGADAFAYDDELGRRFEAAAAGLELAAATPTGALTWTPPRCELAYEFRVRLDVQAVGETKLPISGLSIEGSWTARSDGQRMILRNGDVSIAHLQGGTRRPGGTDAAGTLAEIRLESDGRRWTEVDGPTSLWSAFGSWYGLTSFHPALPDASDAGASIDWPILIHEQGGGVKVEAARGSFELPEGTELSEPESSTIAARVELVRWIELGGRRAAVLRSRFVEDGGGPFSGMGILGGMTGKRAGQGQYVVREDGVLVHAEQRERTDISIRMGIKTMKQVHLLESEARLVRDCAGPVLPPFPDDATPTERAFAAVAALRNHAAAGELAEVEALLDPEIVSAHPQAARCLVAWVERYGPMALGTPEMPMGDEARESQGVVDLVLRARLNDGEDHSDTGELEISMQVHGEQVHVVALRLKRLGDERPLLRVEPYAELTTVAGCDAPDEVEP